MLRIQTYKTDEVFTAMQSATPTVLPDGNKFKGTSARLELFLVKGTVCVTCGIEGTLFSLETHSVKDNPHLNLYAITKEGKWVLMTKDHIMPRSKGGRNALDNYDTMCQPCNSKKADKVPARFLTK